MLKFLFSGFSKSSAGEETQRTVITRLLADLNATLEAMPKKPKITIDPNTGAIDLELPDVMPDEALALPAPETTQEVASNEAEPNETVDEVETVVEEAKAA